MHNLSQCISSASANKGVLNSHSVLAQFAGLQAGVRNLLGSTWKSCLVNRIICYPAERGEREVYGAELYQQVLRFQSQAHRFFISPHKVIMKNDDLMSRPELLTLLQLWGL